MLNTYTHIFIVGIKGVAMANIARILVQMGKIVSGSDVSEQFITDHELEQIPIITSFDPHVLPQATQLVIYSAAHGGLENAQVIEAKKRGIAVVHQAEFIAELIQLFHTSIAVAGCHGKTTTSSMLAYALTKLGVRPSYLVGVSEFNHLMGGERGKKDYFVLEADEYAMNPPQDRTPKFHHFHPTHALVMNIDFDHPDVYSGLEDTKKAFQIFLKQVTWPPEDTRAHIVLCIDDPHVKDVASTLVRDTYVTYGLSPESDVIVSHIQSLATGMQFKVESKLLQINDTFTISLFGEKSVLNAVGVITMLRLLDFSLSQIQIAIDSFTGAKRRFELLHQVGESFIFDDYAHHPQEIDATIQAARTRFPSKRIVVIFQPHTYSRTQSLKEDFVKSLQKADCSLIAPIFGSAREKSADTPITSKDLEKLARAQDIETIYGYDSMDSLKQALSQHIQKGDVIFTMGAGDIYKLAKDITSII